MATTQSIATTYINPVSGRSFPTEEEKQEHRHSMTSGSPAVYVGTYHKYNCGSLNGMWVDISSFDSHREFIEFCLNLHANEHDPELMFQDYENFPSELYSECCFDEETFDTIIEYANHDNLDALNVFLDCYGISEIDKFEEAYQGQFNSEGISLGTSLMSAMILIR